ncbi:diaminopimelate decarboxylase [Candidatus Bathyarchaeota archaeon]|nr:diaminopimelate decarboxylase [Candidatus Bathyarchaeota archaeon]
MAEMDEIMGHLEVVGNRLHVGGVPCTEIADEFGTPTYVYDAERVLENYRRLRDGLEAHADRGVVVYYAVKANFNPTLLRALAGEGAHADVLSIHETEFALRTGFPRERIMFTGTSVTDETMEHLLERGVLINIDSFSQMRRLARVAPEGLEVSVRWNPGEGAGFDPKVITAGARSHGRPIKFGIEEGKVLDLCREALDLGLRPVGLHQHIGSGWTGRDIDRFLDTVSLTLGMAERMTGLLGHDLMQVDFGGGPGIPYRPGQEEFPVERYCEGICRQVADSGLGVERICVESGRYIVGDAGVLLTRVNTVEGKSGNTIVGVDAGFNTLLRPAFYGEYVGDGFREAYHEIVDATRVEGPRDRCTVAGPLCETGDLLAIDRWMTLPEEGDVLAILGAGAYGYSMASVYNLQPRPAEVVVPAKMLVTKREDFEGLARSYREGELS